MDSLSKKTPRESANSHRRLAYKDKHPKIQGQASKFARTNGPSPLSLAQEEEAPLENQATLPQQKRLFRFNRAQLAPASAHLGGVAVRHVGGAASGTFHPFVVLPGAPGITAMAGIIVQVQVIGIVAGNTVFSMTLVVIPTHNAHRVLEITPVHIMAGGGVLVPLPGGIQRLGIAVGGGRSLPGDKTQQLGAGRLGPGIKAQVQILQEKF